MICHLPTPQLPAQFFLPKRLIHKMVNKHSKNIFGLARVETNKKKHGWHEKFALDGAREFSVGVRVFGPCQALEVGDSIYCLLRCLLPLRNDIVLSSSNLSTASSDRCTHITTSWPTNRGNRLIVVSIRISFSRLQHPLSNPVNPVTFCFK